jgi:uncharacterized membrane protein YgdD (TMEM256/DUF423 family)
MQKTFLTIACISGSLAVILGAFGAHALKARLTPGDLMVFETGVKYQMYHTFALITVAFLIDKYPGHALLNGAGYFFMAGILLFSGSLYLLASKNLLGIEKWRWMGPVTPLGGLSFVLGWIFILLTVTSCSHKNKPGQSASMSKTDQNANAINNEKLKNNDALSCRFIVSFISTGAGTDRKAYTKFESFITNYQNTKKVVVNYESIPWGREGEADYCFNLKELSEVDQHLFIDDLKDLLKEYPLVLFQENASAHKKIKTE